MKRAPKKKSPQLPSSLDETMELVLRVLHEQAAARGITPQEYTRMLLYGPRSPLWPRGLRDDDGLTADSEEYKALRAWLADRLYEMSRPDIAKRAASLQGAKLGGAARAAQRRGTGISARAIEAAIASIRAQDGRPTNKAIARKLGRHPDYIRRLRNRGKRT